MDIRSIDLISGRTDTVLMDYTRIIKELSRIDSTVDRSARLAHDSIATEGCCYAVGYLQGTVKILRLNIEALINTLEELKDDEGRR